MCVREREDRAALPPLPRAAILRVIPFHAGVGALCYGVDVGAISVDVGAIGEEAGGDYLVGELLAVCLENDHTAVQLLPRTSS